MRVEVPTFKKCCFCLPLRYGLLVWGYLKLITSVFYVVLLGLASARVMYFQPDLLIIIAVALVICLIDIAFSIVFVVGAHKKDYKLLRAFCYFTFTVLVIYIALVGIYISMQIYFVTTIKDLSSDQVHFFVVRVVEQLVVFFLNIALQLYLLCLTRSEVIKLKNTREFQFVNNAAESQCQMKDTNGGLV